MTAFGYICRNFEGVKRKYKVKEKREQKKKFKKKRTVSNVVPKPLPPSPPPASAPVVETPELSEPVVELSRTADVKRYSMFQRYSSV